MYVKLVSCNAAPSFAGYANPPAFGNERCFGVVAAVPAPFDVNSHGASGGVPAVETLPVDTRSCAATV
tara:strand:+ start:105 stop:308 length:204 start_codon:yes stop_codon:yes gene_type:complete